MNSFAGRGIKRAQKAALFFKEISELFYQAARDNKDLKDLYPNRVKFSADMGICTVLFYSPHGKSYFEEKIPVLILFKPSLRGAIARRIPMRRVPEFIFQYDDEFEEQQKLDAVIEKLKVEGKL